MNQTKGYKNHPQLERCRNTNNPRTAIAAYLRLVLKEASKRGYSFDPSKIKGRSGSKRLSVTKGQLRYELEHLRKKLWRRNREFYRIISGLKDPAAHPLFHPVNGDIESWERR